MQVTAMSWLVYRLTHSALLLGVVGFTGRIPTFILAPISGVLADRSNRRRILVVTQTLAMLQAFIVALLVMTGIVAVWHIIFLSVFLGVAIAFDAPTRQSFVVEMIEKREDLGNAIALNSSLVNGARLVGPSIAGILIAVAGEGTCFLLNAISYVAVIAALLAMRVTPRATVTARAHVLRELKEGFSYSFGFAPIRSVILLLALVSLMGMPYQILMPIFAKEILHGGPRTLGFLMGTAGVGALAGAVYLASLKGVLRLGKIIPLAASIFGVGLIAFSRSTVLPFSLLCMVLAGFGMMVEVASSNTTLQTIVDDDKRGRVMAFYAMGFMGMVPFGSLLAGALASKIGAPNTLLIGGTSCILGSLLFARKLASLKAMVHPIYIRMGISSGVTPGIQTPTELPAAPQS
jgi:MFS family permease